jgi:Nucleotidyl transferase AbiEii toxin, Type IV TA system
MVLAEKLTTAIARGSANTRWRDFLEIHVLAERHEIDGDRLRASLRKVAEHRVTVQTTVAAEFRSVLEYVRKFADPVIRDEVGEKTWDPALHRWRS